MASEKFSPPWQSFVDCLSTVLLIMVFFSIVLVILVSVLSYSISKREMDMVRSAAEKQNSAEEVTRDAEGDNLAGPVDIEAFMTKGEARFIIYYEGLLSEPSPEVYEEFKAWVSRHDPGNKKTLKVVQQVVISDVSISERRITGFKRYYALSRYVKNTVGNQNVMKSFSVIKGDAPENRAIITFE